MRLECYISGTTVVIVADVQPAVVQIDKRLRGYAFNERKCHSFICCRLSLCGWRAGSPGRVMLSRTNQSEDVWVHVVDLGVIKGGACCQGPASQRTREFMWLTWAWSREEPIVKDQPIEDTFHTNTKIGAKEIISQW